MRRIIIIVVVVAIAVGGYLFISKQNTPPVPPAQRLNLRKATIDRGEVTQTITATGGVIANRQSNINFEIAGTVKEVLVTEGQHVEAGQVLARLDDSSQQLSLQQAQSAVTTSQLMLKQLLDPPDPRDVTVAEANVKAAQGAYNGIGANVARPDAIKAAQLTYQKAQSAYVDAQYLRAGAGGQYSQDDPNYQLAVAKEGAASFAMEQARLQLEQAQRGSGGSQIGVAGARIAQAQAQLAQLKAPPAAVQIDKAQAQLDQARLNVIQAQHQLDKTQLKAPYAGIITVVSIDPGELASPGNSSNVVNPTMTITDDSTYYIDVNVDEVDFTNVQPGEVVTFTLDALPGQTLTGKVQRVALTANQGSTVTFTAHVALDATKLPLKVGMTSNAVFTVRHLTSVLRVPNIYLRLDRTSNQSFTHVVNPNGTLSEVPVQVGLRSDEYSEVISGLNEGDTVAISADGSQLPNN